MRKRSTKRVGGARAGVVRARYTPPRERYVLRLVVLECDDPSCWMVHDHAARH